MVRISKNKRMKYKKIKTKRNIKKSRKRTRGGVKTTEQIQKDFMKGSTPITNPNELQELAEAEERERNNNELQRINDELERQRVQSMKGWPTTPMSQKDIRRQNREDELHNRRVNSEASKLNKLTLADLGGSKRRKHKKHKKTRGGNRIGGNNIGANCNDPNFSIYNTNLLKLFPYKGGELQSDDIYKNSEGPQF